MNEITASDRATRWEIATLRERLRGLEGRRFWRGLDELAEAPEFGFLYDPEAGMLRLTREMRTRLDIPDAETFLRQLAVLQTLGEANRRAQAGPPVSTHPAVSQDDAPEAGPGRA